MPTFRHDLGPENLKKVLEIIFEDMKKLGLVTPDMENNKDAILEAVKESLSENDNKLSLNDVNDTNVQKKLMGAIIDVGINGKNEKGEYSTSKETNKYIAALDKRDPEEKKEESPELDKKLLAPSLFNQPLSEVFKNPEKTAADLLSPLKKELEKKTDDPRQKEALGKVSEIEKQLTAALTNMSGGDDPRVTGEVQTVLQGPIAGNVVGWTIDTAANPSSMSELVREITANPGPDPSGTENSAKAAGLMTGALASIADAIADTSFPQTPTNTRDS